MVSMRISALGRCLNERLLSRSENQDVFLGQLLSIIALQDQHKENKPRRFSSIGTQPGTYCE
ncbi:hypothetical protein EYF80_061547 [Liparis tanakae]|uniref:Uncharacterized protein n=1 Tax=Liparis tanakae TaxID=230148 RepID=A0A4Z2EHR5_9TELE|nr:hypothetical protein EYF80_061547 [Liparis tanakae]